MSERSDRDLTQGSILKWLVKLGGPMIIGIAAVMSMSLVDAYFIGRVSAEQLAAIGYTFPVILTLQSLAIGLGAGAASVVSRAYGEGDTTQVKRLSTDSLALGVVIVTVLAVVGWFSIDPVFRLLGATDTILSHVVSYMQVWYLGLPLLVIPQIANALLRAGGDSLYPSIIMVSAAVINAILDPLLILGLAGFPRLEIVGAAWASNGVRAVTLVLSLGIVIFRERMIELSWPKVSTLKSSWGKVLKVAIPAALGSTINPIGVAMVTAFLSIFSASAVAGFGVATRIEAFVAIPMFALSAAIGPLSGQNWSSDKPERVISALKQSYAICIGWGVLSAIGLWFSAAWLAGQFTDDAAVAEQVEQYLTIVPISLMGYGIVTVAAGCFNAIDLAKRSLVFYLARSAVFYVPLSYLARLIADETWVYIAIACANGLSGVLVLWLSLRWLRQARCGRVEPVHAMLSFS